MTKRKDTEGFEVGYGKPPRKSQFQKGQSGNPKGRPKRSRNVDTLLRETFFRTITVTEGGQRKKVTVLEALFRKLAKSALEGDARSVDKMIRLLPHIQAAIEREEQASDGSNGANGQAGTVADLDREVLQFFAEQIRDGDLGFDQEEGVLP